MATIQSTVKIFDGYSPIIKNMIKVNQNIISSFGATEQASGNAFNIQAINAARNALAKVETDFNEVERNIAQSEKAQNLLNNQIQQGQKVADGFAKTIKKTMMALAPILIIGKVVKGGFDRLIGIDTATAKLEALGHSGQAVNVIMRNALDSVLGTAFKMDEAVTTAANAVAAGIKPGKQLQRYLSLTADTAAIAGESMNDMGAIFNKITTSGKAQARELNQISDKGIPIYTMLAKQMGVAAQEVRDLASEGRISTDIFLNAIEEGFGGAAVTMGVSSFKATLDNIGASISRIGANFLNGTGEGTGFFNQIKPRMVDLLNNLKKFESKVIGIGEVFGKVFTKIYDTAATVANFFKDNWGTVAPIIMGVVGAYVAYNAVALITNGIIAAQAFAAKVKAAADMMQAESTFVATVAQHGLNAALWACPITWIVLGIMAIIVTIYAAVAAINKFAGTSYSVTGIIIGAFAVLGAFIWNTVVGVIDAVIQFLWTNFVEPWIGVIEFVLNVFNGGFNSFGDAVKNLLGNIISWFLSLGKVVTKIIDAIFGTNWTAGLSSLQDNVLAWGKNENAITLSREAPSLQDLGVGRIEYGKAWNAGYGLGDVLGKDEDFDDSAYDAGFNWDGLMNGVDDIAGNTAKSAKSLEFAEDDIQYLRDIAERDAINRYTTAEIHIEQNNENHISSNMDLDGVVGYLNDGVEEAVDIATEGGHK